MDRDAVWQAIHQQRRLLADLLDTLTPRQWEQPSLCAGWTVRHVAAHVISSAQATTGQLLVAALRARGNFDRLVDDQARRRAARPVAEIVADYRGLDGSRRHPLGTTHLDPLLDVLVHIQDIAIPLGRSVPMPAAAARAAADHAWRSRFPFGARRKLRGFRLTATDVPWAVGHGADVRGPVESMVLLLTGRPAGLAGLTGSGLDELSARVSPPERVV